MEFYLDMDWGWKKALRNVKHFQSKIQIPHLGIQRPKAGLHYFIDTMTIQCTLCSNHTSHLTASQYPYQAVISFFFSGLSVLIILPTLLSPVKTTLIFKVHHTWSGLLGAFPKQQANLNIFIPAQISYVYYITYHTLSSVHSVVSIDAKYLDRWGWVFSPECQPWDYLKESGNECFCNWIEGLGKRK